MGTRAVVDDGPAHYTITIRRGDDYSRPFEWYSSYAGFQGATVTTPLDLTGRTYVSTIATAWGGPAIATPTVTIGGDDNNVLTWAVTDTITDALTGYTYVADVIENPGTTSERTVIELTIKMKGRATA